MNTMYVIQYVFRAHPGKTEEVKRLFQQWQLLLQPWRPLSVELLGDPLDPEELLLEVRFNDEESAWAAAESAPHCTWYAALVALAEYGPSVAHYRMVDVDSQLMLD